MRRLSISKVTFQKSKVLMASYIDDWGEDDVVLASIAKGTFEEKEPMNWWLAMAMSAKAGNIMMDIGSYSGLYSLMAEDIRADIKVIAFEASAMTYGRLSSNILLNQAELRIVPAHYAISNETGLLELGHAFGIFSMASGESIRAKYQLDHKESVPAATLDRLLCLNGESQVGTIGSAAFGLNFDAEVHAMKIDTEGAEEHVLSGANGILIRYKPHLIVEIFENDVLSRVKDTLMDIGYAVVAECDGSNYIFAHESKLDLLKQQYGKMVECDSGRYGLERLLDVNVGVLQ